MVSLIACVGSDVEAFKTKTMKYSERAVELIFSKQSCPQWLFKG